MSYETFKNNAENYRKEYRDYLLAKFSEEQAEKLYQYVDKKVEEAFESHNFGMAFKLSCDNPSFISTSYYYFSLILWNEYLAYQSLN